MAIPVVVPAKNEIITNRIVVIVFSIFLSPKIQGQHTTHKLIAYHQWGAHIEIQPIQGTIRQIDISWC